jgi:hypothetical protein
MFHRVPRIASKRNYSFVLWRGVAGVLIGCFLVVFGAVDAAAHVHWHRAALASRPAGPRMGGQMPVVRGMVDSAPPGGEWAAPSQKSRRPKGRRRGGS